MPPGFFPVETMFSGIISFIETIVFQPIVMLAEIQIRKVLFFRITFGTTRKTADGWDRSFRLPKVTGWLVKTQCLQMVLRVISIYKSEVRPLEKVLKTNNLKRTLAETPFKRPVRLVLLKKPAPLVSITEEIIFLQGCTFIPIPGTVILLCRV